jgi:hypothetical protein
MLESKAEIRNESGLTEGNENEEAETGGAGGGIPRQGSTAHLR